MSACKQIACAGNKNGFQQYYYAFLEELEDGDRDDINWEKKDKEFERLTEECYPMFEDAFTDEEKQKFLFSRFTYYGLRYNQGLEDLVNEHSELFDDVAIELNKALETTGKKIEELVEEHGDDIKNLLEDIGGDIEEWLNKIGEILQQ